MSPLDIATKHGGRMAMWLSNRLNLSLYSFLEQQVDRLLNKAESIIISLDKK